MYFESLMHSIRGEHVGLVLGSLAIIGFFFAVIISVVSVQWRKSRQTEMELAFRHEMVERGLSVEEIERLLLAGKGKPSSQPEPLPFASVPPPLEKPKEKTVRLKRSATDKKIAGVCGGIAEYLDVDSTLIRAVFVFGTFMSALFPGVITYFVLALLLPRPESSS